MRGNGRKYPEVGLRDRLDINARLRIAPTKAMAATLRLVTRMLGLGQDAACGVKTPVSRILRNSHAPEGSVPEQEGATAPASTSTHDRSSFMIIR
jgi:hypothetical protein